MDFVGDSASMKGGWDILNAHHRRCNFRTVCTNNRRTSPPRCGITLLRSSAGTTACTEGMSAASAWRRTLRTAFTGSCFTPRRCRKSSSVLTPPTCVSSSGWQSVQRSSPGQLNMQPPWGLFIVIVLDKSPQAIGKTHEGVPEGINLGLRKYMKLSNGMVVAPLFLKGALLDLRRMSRNLPRCASGSHDRDLLAARNIHRQGIADLASDGKTSRSETGGRSRLQLRISRH